MKRRDRAVHGFQLFLRLGLHGVESCDNFGLGCRQGGHDLLLVLGVSAPELIQRLREIRVHSLNLRPVLRDGLLKVAGGAFQGFDHVLEILVGPLQFRKRDVDPVNLL